MAYGFDGSTVVDELNRLINGGTSYPSRQDYKDTAAAAKAFALRRIGYIPNDITDTVGLLNMIYTYGSTDRSNWKDMAGICNLLAGTQRLEPAAALREIYS